MFQTDSLLMCVCTKEMGETFSIAIIILLTILFVFFDRIESNWEERRWQEHDQLGTDPADSFDNHSDSHVYRRSCRTKEGYSRN